MTTQAGCDEHPGMSLIVSGASGQFGRRVAQFLLAAQTPDVVLVTRTPGAVGALGAEVRHADFDDPASLEAAFAGATKLLLVSLPVIGARVPSTRPRSRPPSGPARSTSRTPASSTQAREPGRRGGRAP